MATSSATIFNAAPYDGLIPMAERELTAFFNAVTKLYGAEQAKLSAEDWLREVIESDGLPASTREWRSITTKAANWFARRVNSSDLSNGN